MFKRVAKFSGLVLLILCGFFFVWTEQIPDASHLTHGHKIEIDSGSGAVDVIGEPRPDVAVTVDGQDATQRGVSVNVTRHGEETRLRIDEIPHNTRVEVHVPADSSVGVRMSAGQLRIRGIQGDIASLLRSGQMVIDVPDTRQFSFADGSVLAGGISAAPFQRHKGGMFRRFVWEGPGQNNLRAHVTTGQLLIR